jgi:hypothetical protein
MEEVEEELSRYLSITERSAQGDLRKVAATQTTLVTGSAAGTASMLRGSMSHGMAPATSMQPVDSLTPGGSLMPGGPSVVIDGSSSVDGSSAAGEGESPSCVGD